MTTEVREGLGAYRPKNTPDRRLVPEPPRTQMFGNGVGPREFPGVEGWYFDTTTRTYEPEGDRTNGPK